ncbi:MAG TPA: DUF4347 domain-containing protein, partial [Oculatellaceae cyanobacterium]
MNNTYILVNNIDDTQSLISQHSIAFIDKNVPDYESLVRGVVEGTEVVLLNPDSDGVRQITAALAQRVSVTSIHIVSHGIPGQIQLGNVDLNIETINRYAVDFQQWAIALAQDAELVIYGCEVAQDNIGKSLIWQLSKLTGATVTASVTKTGSAALGGDWNLTVTTGTKAADLAFLATTRKKYSGVLAENRTWKSAINGFWDVSSNWTNNQPPLTGDDVTISFPINDITTTYRTGNTSLNSFVSDEAFVFSGGTLTINILDVNNNLTLNSGSLTLNGTTASAIDNFTQTGGALAGTGEVIVNNTFNWSNGYQAGIGKTTLKGNSTFSTTNIKSIDRRTIENQG